MTNKNTQLMVTTKGFFISSWGSVNSCNLPYVYIFKSMERRIYMVEIENVEELSEEELVCIEGAGFLNQLQTILNKSQFFGK